MRSHSREKDYHPLLEEAREDTLLETDRTGSPILPTLLVGTLCLAAFISSAVLGTLYFGDYTNTKDPPNFPTCERPHFRREWRSVTVAQRQDYIRAVQCLTTKPSRMGLNHSLYDDFAYSHIWYGHNSHDSASFLVYHRWFLHLFEDALRKSANTMSLDLADLERYWDWSKDWKDHFAAPVFSTETGFGGEGTDLLRSIRGYCLDEGPFANYSVPFFETITKPHCLSREFLADETEAKHWASLWSPMKIKALLSTNTYKEFVKEMEDGAHLALPKLLHGDFSSLGAPIDPIFMLHHTNLDRLYWEWQQIDPEHRNREYGGPKTAEDSLDRASQEDLLMLGDLGPSVRVREMLRTDSGKLCYSYET